MSYTMTIEEPKAAAWFEETSRTMSPSELGALMVSLLRRHMAMKRAEAAAPKKPCIADFIGYGRRFNPEYRSTVEIMKELREGEQE